MKPKIDEGNFNEMLGKSIAKGKHDTYLQTVKEDYKKYKDFFNEVFVDKKQPLTVYTFKVEYLLKKPIWRIFEILGIQTFNQFAEAIIESMNWDNDHMHGFSFPEIRGKWMNYGASPYTIFAPGWEDDPHPTFKTDEIAIENIDYKKYPKLRFEFDFGDSHLFDINFISTRKFSKKDCVDDFPKITDLRGVGPEQYPDCR